MHLLFFRDRDTFSKTISKTTNSYGRYTYVPNMCRSHNVQSVRVLVFIRHFGLLFCSPQCTGRKQFNECGTACPLTCDNPLPRPCIFLCVRGMHTVWHTNIESTCPIIDTFLFSVPYGNYVHGYLTNRL